MSILATLVTVALFSSVIPRAPLAAFAAPPTGAPPPDSVRAWIVARRYADADSGARQLLERAERMHGAQSLEAAEALDLLVETIWRGGRATQPGARQLAERAAGIKEHLLPAGDIRLVTTWIGLAQVLIQAGESKQARESLERALAVQEMALGKEHLDVAATLSILGDVLNAVGEEKQARLVQQRALAIRERQLPPDDPLLAVNLNGLANIATDLGEYDEALALYRRTIRILESSNGPDAPIVARALGNLARLEQRMGDYAAARESFVRAAAIQAKALGPNDRARGFTLTFLGHTLQCMGDYTAARDTLERALRIRENALGPDHILVATTLDRLADLYREMREYRHARPLYERSLAIRKAKTGTQDENYAVGLMGLAGVVAGSGDLAAAESLSAQAASILKSEYGETSHSLALVLTASADIYRSSGDLSKARALLERALTIERELLGAGHPEEAATEALLANVLWEQEDHRAALAMALEAESMARDHLSRTGRRLSEREALQYAETRTTGLGVALTIEEMGLPDSLTRRVFDAVIRSRAVVLDEMAARHHAVAGGGDASVRRLTSALAAATNRYANLIVRGPDPDQPARFREETDEAIREKESAERELADQSLSYRQERDRSRVGLAEVGAALPPKSVLVAYVQYERVARDARDRAPAARARSPGAAYAAFVLADSGSSISFVRLGSAERIDSLVSQWTLSVRPRAETGTLTSERECRRLGTLLRREIWDPIAPALKNANRVFIVPDGSVNLVSFGALPSGPGRYLVDADPIAHYLSAERDLATRHEDEAKNSGLLALGGLAFDVPAIPEPSIAQAPPREDSASRSEPTGEVYRGTRSACGDFRTMRFQALPGTAREANDVLALWRKSRGSSGARSGDLSEGLVLTGRQGSEAAVKAMAPKAGILHLATHGFFLDGACPAMFHGSRGIGGLAPSSSEGTKSSRSHPPSKISRSPSTARENPLVLTGLALAGANRRGGAAATEEDGILTAEEVAAMDLSGVRWAVLSACDAGAGKAVQGEGVLGLRRAFQIAGASTLIMSIWPVEDQAARQWMDVLYSGRLLRGLDSDDAAREASRQALRARRAHGQSTHPFYWAGFLVVGDWR